MNSMVKSVYKSNRPRLVLLASIVTSIVLVIFFFLFGAISTNVIRGGAAYTQVDMVAGSIFVFIITMIISLSLWPKVVLWLEMHKKNEEFSK
jgi:membrane protein YdbS with pleckstrin-like domain